MPPPGKPPSNLGCILAIIAAPIVLVAGFFIGLVLRDGDDSPDAEHVTLDGGELDGVAWRVDAVRDVDGQTCVFLYEDGAADPLNGTCDLQPQDVTYGDQTVIFGRAADGSEQVYVELDGGDPIEVESSTVDGMDGRFYVKVVDGDVDVATAE
jgi:hypothetical protein